MRVGISVVILAWESGDPDEVTLGLKEGRGEQKKYLEEEHSS